jgi:iron transport multicopper oxidase
MVIADPNSPYQGKYDGEFVVTVSDWYHQQVPELLPAFLAYTNPTGAEPVPDSAVMNDMPNPTFAVEPGKTYLFRIINIGAFAGHYFWFQGHQMQVVEVDGVWTEEAETEMIYLSTAQRYSVLVTMRNDTSANFPLVTSMDEVSVHQGDPGARG